MICKMKNTFVGVFFNKIGGLKSCNFIKKRLQHRCFPVRVDPKMIR